MDKSTIIRLAREAGLWGVLDLFSGEFGNANTEEDCLPDLTRFAALVAAHEREACAQVCIELGKEAELASGIPPTKYTAAAKTLREHAVAHYAAARYIRKRNDQRTI